MVVRKQLRNLATFVASTVLTANIAAYAAGGWTHFVEQQIDVNNPNSHGAGAQLSPSQQHDLLNLDDDVSALEDQLSQAINASQMNETQASELRNLLGKIESRQTDILTRGVLNYEDAQSILLDEQRVKATLKSAASGKAKPVESDYFDSKDAFEFRDHLIRKLYFNRTHGALSANEYDELRSHVEHAGQRLDREGKKAAHDKKLLKRMRELESQINELISGGRTAPVPRTEANQPGSKLQSSGAPPTMAAPAAAPAGAPGTPVPTSVFTPSAAPAAAPSTAPAQMTAPAQTTAPAVSPMTMPSTTPQLRQ